MHDVHGPDLVTSLRHGQCLRLVAHLPLAWLDALIQIQLPAYPAVPLVVPPHLLDVAKVQNAQNEAPVALLVRQLEQPVGDLFLLCNSLGFVTVEGLADLEGLAVNKTCRLPSSGMGVHGLREIFMRPEQ